MGKNTKNIIIIKYFFDQNWISKKSILSIFEKYEKWIIIEIKNSISIRAFENLFFRQFYFLARNWKFELFLESMNYLINNKDIIIYLLNNYHYELIFRDYLEERIIFRKELFNILKENLNIGIVYNKQYKDWYYNLYSVNLLNINSWNIYKTIDFNLWIYDNSSDIQDMQSSISLNITSWNIKIYNLSFYYNWNNIFISNLQFFKWSNNFIITNRYHKILFYILLEITKKIWIKEIISFSNQNHPCKYHEINNWFKWDYDNICKNIWMKLWQDWYLYWEIDELEVKWLNIFIKENIDYNIQNIFNILKI